MHKILQIVFLASGVASLIGIALSALFARLMATSQSGDTSSLWSSLGG